LISNPKNEEFFADITGGDIEKNSEQIIENNLRGYYAQKNFNNDNIEEVQLKEDIKTNQNAANVANEERKEKPKEKKKKSLTEDDIDSGKRNKSLEFEDYSNAKKSNKNKLDTFDNKTEAATKQSTEKNLPLKENINQNNNINIEEIDEEIVIDPEESAEAFSDKRFIGSGNSISQSGPDLSVSSKDLEKKYQYIEPVNNNR